MALPWRRCVMKRTCLPTSALIHSIRSKTSLPWFWEHVETSEKERKVKEGKEKVPKQKVPKEKEHKAKVKHRSILRNPGVVTVSKLSQEELCQHLANNVVYREGPLLAINKPQGLTIAGSSDSEENSLVSLLPNLQQALQIKPELHVVKAAPKESSGLVLLSTCHATTKRLEEFYSQCRKAKKPVTSFCAIVLGEPEPADGEVQTALKEEQIKDNLLVFPVRDPSKGSLERREVKETQTLYKVLDSANGCSLLQLQPMTVFRSQLLVHCTLKFCPILGDHTYSSRVAKVLGKDIYMPTDVALPQTQLVELKILRKMHFSPQQLHRMPLHLHLHQLIMPQDPPGRYPDHLQAPPPPFFQRTMELLELKMEN